MNEWLEELEGHSSLSSGQPLGLSERFMCEKGGICLPSHIYLDCLSVIVSTGLTDIEKKFSYCLLSDWRQTEESKVQKKASGRYIIVLPQKPDDGCLC